MELLLAIFSALLASAEKPGRRQKDDRVKRVMELSMVSVLWWNVLTNAPRFWTTVQMGCLGTAITLQRSKDLPLDIRAFNSSKDLHQPGIFVNLIKPHAGRWRSLRWSGEIRASGLGSILAGRNSQCPRLEILDIEAPYDRINERVSLGDASQLRELRLTNISITWRSDGFPVLKKFFYSGISVDALPPVTTLLVFLSACPLLEEIEFFELGAERESWELGPASPPPSKTYSFTRLKSIKLDTVLENFAAELLPAMRANNLIEFTFKVGFEDEYEIQTILSALTRGGEDALVGAIWRDIRGGSLDIEIESGSLEVRHHGSTSRKKGLTIDMGCEAEERVAELVKALLLDRISIPIKLRLNDYDIEEPLPAWFLNHLPTTTEIIIEDETNALSFLKYLAKPIKIGGTETWPCPNLAAVRLRGNFDVDKEMDEEVENFKAIIKAVRGLKKHRPSVEVYGRKGDPYHKGVSSFLGHRLRREA